jgi:regulator of replication initiation timing
LELAAKCDIASSSTVTVSSFQNYNQQIEAVLNGIERLEERISSSVTERTNLDNEFEQLRKDCEAKLAQMKSTWENENETFVTSHEYRNRSTECFAFRLWLCGEDHGSGHSTEQYCSAIADRCGRWQ